MCYFSFDVENYAMLVVTEFDKYEAKIVNLQFSYFLYTTWHKCEPCYSNFMTIIEVPASKFFNVIFLFLNKSKVIQKKTVQFYLIHKFNI